MAEKPLSVELSSLPERSLGLDRVGQVVDVILSTLNQTIEGLGPLVGEGDAAKLFMSTFGPGLKGGTELLKNVKSALTFGADNLLKDARALNHTEQVNVESTNHNTKIH